MGTAAALWLLSQLGSQVLGLSLRISVLLKGHFDFMHGWPGVTYRKGAPTLCFICSLTIFWTLWKYPQLMEARLMLLNVSLSVVLNKAAWKALIRATFKWNVALKLLEKCPWMRCLIGEVWESRQKVILCFTMEEKSPVLACPVVCTVGTPAHTWNTRVPNLLLPGSCQCLQAGSLQKWCCLCRVHSCWGVWTGRAHTEVGLQSVGWVASSEGWLWGTWLRDKPGSGRVGHWVDSGLGGLSQPKWFDDWFPSGDCTHCRASCSYI